MRALLANIVFAAVDLGLVVLLLSQPNPSKWSVVLIAVFSGVHIGLAIMLGFVVRARRE